MDFEKLQSVAVIYLFMVGETDTFTISWAEFGKKDPHEPLVFDDKWHGRLKKLFPIRLFPIGRGEGAPYPSCINRN